MQEQDATLGPFGLESLPPDDRCLTWSFDPTHWPDPLTPLAFAVVGDALARGKSRALRAYGKQVDVRVLHVHGYRYQTIVPTGPGNPARYRAGLRAAMGALWSRWDGDWLPEVRAHLAFWRGVDLSRATGERLLGHLDETLARMERVWEIHFLLLTPTHGAIREFRALHAYLLGGSATDALALLRGFDNATLRMSRALRALAEEAGASPEVRAAFRPDDAAGTCRTLAGTAAGRALLARLAAFLDAYGQRRERLSPEYPSWREDVSPVLRAIHLHLERPAAWPEAEVAERETACEAARSRLACFPGPVVAEFEFLLRAAQEATVLTEDHNFWIDACCLFEVRRVALEVGRRLVAVGAIDAPAEVFFLLPGELRRSGGEIRAIVARRRAELEQARAIVPPPTLGARPEASPNDGGAPLTGVGASGGRAKGRARLAEGLAASGGFAPGDVLVASAASPVLAPLLGLAGGLVTETGGILSHSAVIAREYAVPAVLGVPHATGRIREGQLVEVDGDRGIVRFVDAPEG